MHILHPYAMHFLTVLNVALWSLTESARNYVSDQFSSWLLLTSSDQLEYMCWSNIEPNMHRQLTRLVMCRFYDWHFTKLIKLAIFLYRMAWLTWCQRRESHRFSLWWLQFFLRHCSVCMGTLMYAFYYWLANHVGPVTCWFCRCCLCDLVKTCLGQNRLVPVENCAALATADNEASRFYSFLIVNNKLHRNI